MVKWDKLAGAVDTIVVLMGIGKVDQISRDLMNAGMKKGTKIAIVASGTTDKQKIVRGTLATIASVAKKAGVKPPAVIVIGKVAGLDNLEWFK